MKPIYFLVLIAVLLASCSTAPSENDIQTAIVQTNVAQPTSTSSPQPTDTQTPEPTSTPTPIPLADLDLESILIRPGDLPAGYTGEQIRDTAADIIRAVPQPVNQISQQIAHGSRVGGVVVILVYDTITDTTDAYNSLLNDVMPGDVRVVQTVGEQSQVKVLLFISIEQVGLIFVRCNTVVFINLLDTLYPEDAIAFAQRLDERISEIICP